MSEVVTGDAVVVEVRVAQMPSRAVAIVIDMVVQLTVLVGTYAILGAFAVISDSAMFTAVMIALMVLVMVGYPVLFETLTRGRSLGKLALGLRVVSDDGSPERFRQALFRGLAGVVEFWLLYGAPALISSLVSQRGKRLGDIFAGTIVISERAPRDNGQLIVMPPPLASWAATLELSQLPDEVVQAARQYLSRWHDLSPQVQHEMGVRIATQLAAYVSPAAPPGVPPHAYLSAVLAERRRREETRLAKRAGANAHTAAANGTPQTGPYQAGPYQGTQPGPYQPAQPTQPGPHQGPPPQAGPYGQPAPYGRPAPPAPEPPKATPGGFAPPQ
ncbi:putative RDD family membrane protein YckC [Nonomuraea polychroma]|uniref:Putative RDD family membrane protein YckC n=1 Tax=Nonomuraea polychroma TaxID=46176 RepID=A0A438MNP0_9ACTN|nr:RDD family protein [Nonomuraea polychroma]RVX47467.1 putative RDD family membrane protein YckC [Nonomuraea polychroma]